MKTHNKFLIIMVLAFTAANSQNHRLTRITTGVIDSLHGFDEAAAIKAAVSEHYEGTELDVRIKQLKRNYINSRYNLEPATDNTRVENMAKATAVTSCDNVDFENSSYDYISSSSQVAGWTVTSGSNLTGADNCYLNPVNAAADNKSETIDCGHSGYIDPNIGIQYPVFSIFGTGAANQAANAANLQLSDRMCGNMVLRLNNNIINDNSLQKLSRTFVVTPDNALFKLAFISVIASQHSCCQASALQVVVSQAGNPLSCPGFSIWAPSSQCSMGYGQEVDYFINGTNTAYNQVSTTAYNIYNKWKVNAYDFSSYMGQTITIDITAYDCTAGGHYGYAYIDAQCGPVTFSINGRATNANGNYVYLKTCSRASTVNAPSGFSSYVWTSPSGMTTSSQSLTVNGYGTYTLTLNQTSSCPVTKYVQVQNMAINTTEPLLCEGSSATLTAGGFVSYEWSTGETSDTIVVSPVVNTHYGVTGYMSNGEACFMQFLQQVTPCTGISKLSNAHAVKIYPNPNHGEFTINTEELVKHTQLIVENTLGQTVHSQNILPGNNTIKTPGLKAGIYYYTITDDKLIIIKGKMTID